MTSWQVINYYYHLYFNFKKMKGWTIPVIGEVMLASFIDSADDAFIGAKTWYD